MQLSEEIVVQVELIGSMYKKWNSRQHFAFREEGAAHKEQLQLDINLSGRLNQIPMPQQSTENDSLNATSLKKISTNCQTNLSATSLVHHYIYSGLPVPISAWQEKERGLLAIAEACFLKDSDPCNYQKSQFRVLFLKTWGACLVAVPTQKRYGQIELFNDIDKETGEFQKKHTRSRSQLKSCIKDRISLKSSMRLGSWGMILVSKSEMGIDGFPKTEKESFVLALTANIQCRKIESNRITLQQCLNGDKTILDQHLDGDRYYSDESPSIRASGSRAFKVVQENQKLRPLHPSEIESLMGWSQGSTAKGITKDGKEVDISKTQRCKILGNGICPQEITHICQNLVPILEKLELKK